MVNLEPLQDVMQIFKYPFSLLGQRYWVCVEEGRKVIPWVAASTPAPAPHPQAVSGNSAKPRSCSKQNSSFGDNSWGTPCHWNLLLELAVGGAGTVTPTVLVSPGLPSWETKPGDLNNRNLFSHSSGSPRSRCCEGWFLGRALLLAFRLPSFRCVFIDLPSVPGGTEVCVPFSYKDTSPILWRPHPSDLI